MRPVRLRVLSERHSQLIHQIPDRIIPLLAHSTQHTWLVRRRRRHTLVLTMRVVTRVSWIVRRSGAAALFLSEESVISLLRHALREGGCFQSSSCMPGCEL